MTYLCHKRALRRPPNITPPSGLYKDRTQTINNLSIINKTMKIWKYATLALVCGGMMVSQVSCNSAKFTETGKGALIGGGAGTALGAGLGALIGGGKGAGIGAAIGAAVGAGAGTLIGNRMQKQRQELERQLAEQAKVEETTDANGLKAIKVTFDGGILFKTNEATLSPQARKDLTGFAANLEANPGTDVQIFGYTDNTGTMAVNQRVSTARADAVEAYLVNAGVSPSRLSAKGIPMADYVASNDTAAGRAENRRVEIYIYAGQDMIKQAEAGTLQ